MTDPGARFDAEAADFEASLAEHWNRMKYEMALENVLAHLPRGDSLRVLDAGGGTGELGLRLAARGHRLMLLDPSPAMLRFARDKAARAGVAQRCSFVRQPVEALPSALAGERFDAVLCHNVLEYVADPAAAARALAGLLAPGGVLSLLAMNSAALPLQRLWQRGDPEAALAQFGRREYENRFGITARTFPPTALIELAAAAGLTVRAWYGVRMFYDYTADPRKGEPAFYDAVKRLEALARATDPYRLIGRDVQVIAELA